MSEDWYEIRIGFVADCLADAEDLIDKWLKDLPYPQDFIASVSRSESLSNGDGFDD